VGNALLAKNTANDRYPLWGKGMSADADVRKSERSLEVEVSAYLSRLLFSYLEVPDAASATSQRSELERASINFLGADCIPIDEPSADWLGHFARPNVIRLTGLWNIQHNGGSYYRNDLKVISRTIFSPRMAGT
jgi:hypothetical protein